MSMPQFNYKTSHIIGLVTLALVLAVLACDMDQNFPDLIVNAKPSTFDPWVGEMHYWSANVVPSAKYELVLTLGNIVGVYSEGGFSTGDIFVNGDSCGDCRLSLPSVVPNSENKLIFIGPANGRVRIRFVPGQRYGKSTIQLKEYGNNVTALESYMRTALNNFNLFHIIPSIFLVAIMIIGIRKSRVLNLNNNDTNGQIPRIAIRIIWFVIALLMTFLLIQFWFN
jgi:hypothetical protein